ncbi:hypothetical protein OB08_12955 [Microbacterium sp. HJ5]
MLNSFLEQFPQAHGYDSVEAMLQPPSLPDDLVIVATPPSSHLAISLAAMESGRNVLCEKPLALNVSEAQTMLASAQAHGVRLAVCDVRLLGVAASTRTKQLLEDGAIGDPYHVTWINRAQRNRSGIEYQPATKWFLNRSISGGGTLMDWGPYDFAALDDLLNPVRVEVSGAWLASPRTAAAGPGEDDVEQHVGATLRYFRSTGAPVTVTYERAACTHGRPQSTTEIEGAAGAIRWDWIDWVGEGAVTLTKDNEGTPQLTTEKFPQSGEAHDRPLARYLEGLSEDTLRTSERALFRFQCLQAVYESVATGARVIIDAPDSRR